MQTIRLWHVKLFFIACGMIAATLSLSFTPGSQAPGPAGNKLLGSVDPSKELTISDPTVIDDASRALDPCMIGQEPLPPWSFGRMMQKIADQAGAPDASAFVKDWLDTWTEEQLVNGFVLSPVAIDAFITNPWLAVSGGKRLDLGRAPFRLLSFVNRIDLSEQDGKGEFRIVYGATRLEQPTCEPIRFWVILEFELPVQTAQDRRALAQRWHKLSSMPFGESYNSALQTITDDLTSARLKHVNTAEEEASVLEWNWRSFAINGPALVNVPLVQTPDLSLDESAALTSYINANAADILAGRHVVPTKLLGGDTRNLDWSGTGLDDPIEVRHHFALATCNGCHAGETGTLFVHTNRRRRGEPTTLSQYLTGETITDPGGQLRTFNELARRAAYVATLLQ